MSKCALTTFDNPFDPFNEFHEWFRFDTDKGYNSCQLLDRTSNTSEQMSESENDKEIERAIDLIISYDFRNIYKKVKME